MELAELTVEHLPRVGQLSDHSVRGLLVNSVRRTQGKRAYTVEVIDRRAMLALELPQASLYTAWSFRPTVAVEALDLIEHRPASSR